MTNVFVEPMTIDNFKKSLNWLEDKVKGKYTLIFIDYGATYIHFWPNAHIEFEHEEDAVAYKLIFG